MLIAATLIVALRFTGPAASGREIFVSAGRSGDGSSSSSPLGTIQAALARANPGDSISIAPGRYAESLVTVRAGAADAPITLRATSDDATDAPLVTSAGRVLTIQHAHVHIDGLAFDGQYGADDAVKIGGGAEGLRLRRVEVSRSGRDCIDLASPGDVLIEDSLVHHCLNATGGRTDAHGIVAGAVHGLTIRRTIIHTFSGDAVQLDPDRAAPGWDDVTVEGCQFWLAPLSQPENGFPAGTIPGENAIDTKTFQAAGRSRLVVRDSVFSGFRTTLIANAAALNLKEHIDAIVDRVTVRDSLIGFRLRGPAETGARVRISNAVVHDVATAFRYEDDIQQLRIWHSTLGHDVVSPFQRAASAGSLLDVRNLLVLGTALPSEASGASNMRVDASGFVDAAGHDYHLQEGAGAVGRAVPIPEITSDRDGGPRPFGGGPDVGAYEWNPERVAIPEAPRNLRVRQ